MEESVNKFDRAFYLTKVISIPKQSIYTFWNTNFKYLCVSPLGDKSILRTGDLICSKPVIITPNSITEMFQGFSDEEIEFAERTFKQQISQMRILGYQFQNKPHQQKTFEMPVEQLLKNVQSDKHDESTAILKSPDDIWGMSLLKASFELIQKSVKGNINDLEERGFFLDEHQHRKNEIEILFSEAEQNSSYLNELGAKLQEYQFFEEYEDRFYGLIRKSEAHSNR